MARQRRTRCLSALLATSFVLVGCQGSESSSQAAQQYPSGPVTMSAGANPGSGLDLTIRAVVDSLQENLVDVPLPIENRPGKIEADCLAAMVQTFRGADDQVSATSLSMMMNELRGLSPYGFDDVTMIARLMTEYFAAATDDQAPFDLLVRAAGGDPALISYVPFEGGGDQTAALLEGDISVAIGGVSEFIDLIRSGTLRALGVLAENRLPGFDAPTAREQGLDVTLSNWRGLYGPPDMPGYAVAYWQQALGEMVTTTTWEQIAERSQFTTTFMTGQEFQAFLGTNEADLKTALTQGRP